MTESPFVKAEGPEPPDRAEMDRVRAEVYAYYREQMQPDRAEIERVRAEVYRTEMELSRQRNKLAQAIDELYHVTNSLRRAESKLFDNYQLIAQLSGYLDSIEWGTYDEWTRSQTLRERAHEYVESFTVSNTITT